MVATATLDIFVGTSLLTGFFVWPAALLGSFLFQRSKNSNKTINNYIYAFSTIIRI